MVWEESERGIYCYTLLYLHYFDNTTTKIENYDAQYHDAFVKASLFSLTLDTP